jgi:hypothetical protein
MSLLFSEKTIPLYSQYSHLFACCRSLQNSKLQPGSGYIQLAKQLLSWHYINNKGNNKITELRTILQR